MATVRFVARFSVHTGSTQKEISRHVYYMDAQDFAQMVSGRYGVKAIVLSRDKKDAGTLLAIYYNGDRVKFDDWGNV